MIDKTPAAADYASPPAQAPALTDVEPVAWRVYCTISGATGYVYTEQLPFHPGPGVNVRREPEPLYAHPPVGDDLVDGHCFYCREMTNRFAGDPGKWPLRFCQPDGTGIHRFHHTDCVVDRLRDPPAGNAAVEALERPEDDVAEDDPDVVLVAHAIAEHGIGRAWNDFLPTSAWDVDHGDLIEYARAAVVALRAALQAREAESGTREAVIEECAKHLEHKADILTNSLHCGDNSQTIASTHRQSRTFYAAAKLIRALSSTDGNDVDSKGERQS